MGDIAIDIFLGTLKNLITSSNYLNLATDKKHQLQSLADKINYLRGFLKIMKYKRNEHPKVMGLVKRIRDVVFEAENIVELYVALVFKANHASDPLLRHRDLSLNLRCVREKICPLMIEVKQIYAEKMYDQNLVAVKELKYSSAERGGRSRRSKVAEGNLAVGFKKEVEKLTRKLHDSGEGGQLEIISIIGEAGVGKTTLAREVYDQRLTSDMFEICAWVVIPHDDDKRRRKRDLLIRILKSAFPDNNEDYEKSNESLLGEKLLQCLKDKKYLIVMDDIGSIEIWNDIQRSLPRRHNGSNMWCIEAWNNIQRSLPRGGNGSKVMFTSRLPIQLDGICCVPHMLGSLTESCWELLEKKVFGKKLCPPKLVEIGKQIAQKCEGLPLSIIIVAGILVTQDKTLDVWQEISNQLSSVIGRGRGEKCMSIIELSYNHLPLHLKACFLYIGAHPEDYEINVRKLIWLWIAEGFIQQSEGGESLETIAKGYLIDLIDRNLVMVARRNKYSGEIKKCYMHDLLRRLCLRKARQDKFLEHHSISRDNRFPIDCHCPRLFVAHPRHGLSLPPPARNLRSFTCFPLASGMSFQEQNLSFFSEYFKLLKVLNLIVAVRVEEIGLGDLFHLRYLAIKPEDGYLEESCFDFLPNLETFILHDNNAEFSLPPHIFKMVKLRHLYSNNGPFHFHHISYDENTRNMLDSLHTLVPMCSCPRCLRFLEKTPNLKRLVLVPGGSNLYNDLMLSHLEHLKCLEKLTVRGWFQEDQIKRVATTRLKLPLTLTWLTLINTNLKWDEVSIILQRMSSLETLQLRIDACKGPVWNTSEIEETFSRLKCLELSSLDIKKWNASVDQFPKLEVLVIKYCASLKGIPIEFADRHELREIKVKMSSPYVMKSARKIWIKQRNIKGDDNCLNLVFDYGYGYATNVDGDNGEHDDDDDDDDDGKRTMMMTEMSYKMQCKLMTTMIEQQRRRRQ